MANIPHTDIDNPIADERRHKDRYRYGHRYIDNRKQYTKAQHNIIVLSHNSDSRFDSSKKLYSGTSENTEFVGYEQHDKHAPSRQGKRNELKLHSPIMEREPYRLEAEKARLQASRKFEGSVEEFALSDIPDEMKATILNEATSLVQDIFRAVQNKTPIVEVLKQKQETLQQKGGVVFVGEPKPAETGQAPDLSEIPLWQGRKKNGMPLSFLQTHYGKWLSVFGAEQDDLFQDQIRKHDSKLLQGVRNQLREEGQGRTHSPEFRGNVPFLPQSP